MMIPYTNKHEVPAVEQGPKAAKQTAVATVKQELA